MFRRKTLAAALVALAASAPPAAFSQLRGAAGDVRYSQAAQDAVAQGKQALEEGRYTDAIAAADQAVQLETAYPDAHLVKGHALKAMQAYTEAAKAYTDAWTYDPTSAEALNGRGECMMEMSPPDYNLALNDFMTSLSLNRNNPAALSNLGHVMVLVQENPYEAIRNLDAALALRPEDARALRDRGMARALLQEYDKAATDLLEAIRVDSSDYENFSTMAQVQIRQEDYAGAVESWSRAIETYKPKKRTDPDNYTLGYILRADSLLMQAEKETDAAAREAQLERVIADANSVLAVYDDRYPDSYYALYRRGRAERLLERYSAAVNSLKDAIQLVPPGTDAENIADAYLYRGICWYYIGLRSDDETGQLLSLARRDFEQASSVSGGFQDPRVFLWIGMTYHQQGNYREAIDYYNQAIAKSPSFAVAHVNKGRAYMDLREYNKAIESFSNAILAEPNVGTNYYFVGVACIRLEDYTTAVEFLRLALDQDDPQPRMYGAMAAALRALGRDELAEQYESKATEAPATAS